MAKIPEKINLSQIINETSDQYGCFRIEGKGVISEFLGVIMNHLKNGKAVDLSPIGVLYTEKAKKISSDGEHKTIIKLKPSQVSKKMLRNSPD